MMISDEITATLPHGLILILDPKIEKLPTSLEECPVTATESALAVGVLNEFDGETSVHLTDSDDERSNIDGMTVRWRGVIRTSGRIAVMNVQGEILLEAPAERRAELTISSNDPLEPDLVCFRIGRP